MTKRNMSAILMFLFGFMCTNLIGTESTDMSAESGNQEGNSIGDGSGGIPAVAPELPKAPEAPKKPESKRDLPLFNDEEKLKDIRNLSFEQLENRKKEVLRLLAALAPDAERISTGFEQLKSELAKVVGQVSGEFESQIQGPLQNAQTIVTQMNIRKTELQAAINDLDQLKTSLQKQYETVRQTFGTRQQEYETLELQLTVQKENKINLDMRNSELQTKMTVVNESLKSLEMNIATIQSQIVQSSIDLKTITESNNKMEAEYKARQTELSRKNQDYKVKSGELNKTQAELQKLTSKLLSSDNKNSAEVRKITVLNDQIVDLGRNINALQGLIRESQASISQIDNQIKLSNSLRDQLNKAVSDATAQYRNAEKEGKALENQAKDKFKKLNDVNKFNERQKALILKTNSQASELTTSNATKSFEIDSLRKQITNMFENKAVYDQQLAEAVRTLIKFKSENDALNRSIKDLKDDINKETKDLTNKLKLLQKQGQEIAKISKNMQDKGASMRSLADATAKYRQYTELIEKFNAEITAARTQATAFEMQITQLDASRENLLQATAAQSTAVLNNPATAQAVFNNNPSGVPVRR